MDNLDSRLKLMEIIAQLPCVRIQTDPRETFRVMSEMLRDLWAELLPSEKAAGKSSLEKVQLDIFDVQSPQVKRRGVKKPR